jgi:hypothetical protein
MRRYTTKALCTSIKLGTTAARDSNSTIRAIGAVRVGRLLFPDGRDNAPSTRYRCRRSSVVTSPNCQEGLWDTPMTLSHAVPFF